MNFLKREGINLATIFLNDLDRSRSGSRVFSRSRDIEWLSTTFTPCGSFWMWFFEQLRSSWQDFNCEMFVPQNRNDPELSEANFHAFSVSQTPAHAITFSHWWRQSACHWLTLHQCDTCIMKSDLKRVLHISAWQLRRTGRLTINFSR